MCVKIKKEIKLVPLFLSIFLVGFCSNTSAETTSNLGISSVVKVWKQKTEAKKGEIQHQIIYGKI